MNGLLDGRLALVTGASSGIGAAVAHAFAREGARLLLVARRHDRLRALAEEIAAARATRIRTDRLDTTSREDVERFAAGLPAEWAVPDILVNNAGKSRGLDKLHEGRIEDWEEMIDTNLKGLLYVDRAFLPAMVRRGSGHLIHVGSIAGHEVYPGGNVYCATKSAVDAITRGVRIDLSGTGVKVSTVDPGLVETEFSLVRFHGDAARAKTPYQGMQPLRAEDVAETILFMATRPVHVNLAQVVVLPAAQASATVVHRVPPRG